MTWISEPFTELPAPKILPIRRDDQETVGIDDGDWVRWPNQNPQLPKDYFLHRDWYYSGFGFSGSKKMSYKLKDFIDDNHKYHLRHSLRDRNITYEDLRFDDIHRMSPPNRHSAFYSYYGGTPCFIWQDPVRGWWNLSNYFGTIQGVEVSLHKSVEWQLRSKTMIGFMYWYGKNCHSLKVSKSIVLGGKTGWDWNQVDILLWGYYASKFDRSKRGIQLMNDRYLSLSEFAGKMKVGPHDVIPKDLLSDYTTKWRWQKWLIDRLKEGKSIGWQKKTGFRYHAGKYEWYHVSVDEMRPIIETVRKLGKL